MSSTLGAAPQLAQSLTVIPTLFYVVFGAALLGLSFLSPLSRWHERLGDRQADAARSRRGLAVQLLAGQVAAVELLAAQLAAAQLMVAQRLTADQEGPRLFPAPLVPLPGLAAVVATVSRRLP